MTFPTNQGISIAAAVLAAAVSATPAQAEGPELHGGIVAGLERTDTGPGAGARDGFYYGANLAADWSLGPIKAGVEGELGESRARATDLPGQPAQGLFANAVVRLTVPVTDGTRVFARGGYAYHRIDRTAAPDFDGHGYVMGAGAEVDLVGNVALRGEYRYSDYGQAVRGQHFLAGLTFRF
jgi:outer membrane immunogenic protein